MAGWSIIAMTIAMHFSAALPFLFAAGAYAQVSAEYTDEETGITFQRFSADAIGYSFGIAMPSDTSSTDFIGQVTGPSTGWSGVSLAGQMLNSLLIVTYDDADAIDSGFYMANTYGSPPEIEGDFSMTPIPSGTSVTADGFKYTFLCSDCIQSDGTTFQPDMDTVLIGWAYSQVEPVEGIFTKHSMQGQVPFDIASARSEDFEAWSSMVSS
ncbi:hypothetical protein BDY21DRAFT_186912 [Lineolata rhizophorae]|uniref:Cellobiose dehydrogenase-like cytochrome domain-containing protein n=1 Tax=Lineolata rhizophorae TaxID=578093 RepID=A0A6A6P892_9PEZI|nr:hypothetical protein BDY21DRAFT_186912 [Lineolata rhizophorae]